MIYSLFLIEYRLGYAITHTYIFLEIVVARSLKFTHFWKQTSQVMNLLLTMNSLMLVTVLWY